MMLAAFARTAPDLHLAPRAGEHITSTGSLPARVKTGDRMSLTPSRLTMPARRRRLPTTRDTRRGAPPGRERTLRALGDVSHTVFRIRLLIDRHPEWERVLVASPCSGYGFKHLRHRRSLAERVTTERAASTSRRSPRRNNRAPIPVGIDRLGLPCLCTRKMLPAPLLLIRAAIRAAARIRNRTAN